MISTPLYMIMLYKELGHVLRAIAQNGGKFKTVEDMLQEIKPYWEEVGGKLE